MRSSRRTRPPRTDEQIIAHPDTMALLFAVVDGRIVRGEGDDLAIHAPYMLNGESVRLGVMILAREELLDAPISGPPRIAPRGQIVLDKAIGVY